MHVVRPFTIQVFLCCVTYWERLFTHPCRTASRDSSCGEKISRPRLLCCEPYQQRTTQWALTKACPRPVAKCFLHVGDAAVRRQDTCRTSFKVVEPLVGDMRVVDVFNSRHLLTLLGEECVLQAFESSPVRIVKVVLGAAVH